MDYIVTWFEQDEREAVHESVKQAIKFAKGLVDAGRPRVQIKMPGTNAVIKGKAILDIYDAIENRDAY